jgi:hypothetical protein
MAARFVCPGADSAPGVRCTAPHVEGGLDFPHPGWLHLRRHRLLRGAIAIFLSARNDRSHLVFAAPVKPVAEPCFDEPIAQGENLVIADRVTPLAELFGLQVSIRRFVKRAG